jgi:Flp pilus assembly protein TadD
MRIWRCSWPRTHFERAVQLRPDWTKLRQMFGIALAQSQRWAEAIPQFEAAVQAMPEDAELRGMFGVILTNAGRLPDAVAQFERALQLRPDFVDARENLARVRRALGSER